MLLICTSCLSVVINKALGVTQTIFGKQIAKANCRDMHEIEYVESVSSTMEYQRPLFDRNKSTVVCLSGGGTLIRGH